MKVVNRLYDKITKYGFKQTCCKIYNKITKKEERLYAEWRQAHELTEAARQEQKRTSFEKNIKFSIVVPLFESNKVYLQQLVESIFAQTYFNWELCLSDGGGKKSELKDYLEHLQKIDSRIKCIRSKEKLGISANTNAALSMASGDYIVFADHDDLLSEMALYECAKLINTEKNGVDIIYTDEDKVSMDGKNYFQPHFKPDYNSYLLQCVNYFCHLVVVSRKMIKQIGGLNSEFDGAQDYDFVFRCVENTNKIYHIPKILYHWRAHMDSTAENPESKEYAFEAGKRVIQEHYKRIGINEVEVSRTDYPGIYRSKYKINEEPTVIIVVYNITKKEYLKRCLSSIEKQQYSNYKIIIAGESKDLKDTNVLNSKFLSKIKLMEISSKWSLAKQKNCAIDGIEGECFLFLDSNCELIGSDSIKEMVGILKQKNIGAVGSKVYYKKNLIEHAGMAVGIGEFANNLFENIRKTADTYFNRSATQMEYSAVSGMCFLVDGECFEKVQGFDEKIKGNLDNVDLCLKIRQLGKKIVYTPYAEVYHWCKDKKENKKTDIMILNNRWKEIIKEGDPYYNKNLTRRYADCRIDKLYNKEYSCSEKVNSDKELV